MKRSWTALSFIVSCAIVTPAGAAGTWRVSAPMSKEAKLKRRQLAIQHTHAGFREYARRDLIWATRHFREAVRLEPDNAGLRATLGGVYAARKQLREAEAQFRAAARLEPSNASHLERLGVVLERQDRPLAAAAVYKNVIWVNHQDAAAHQHLGWVLERLGQKEEAIRAYQTALVLEPENLPARVRLTRLVAQRDRPRLAGAQRVARRPVQ